MNIKQLLLNPLTVYKKKKGVWTQNLNLRCNRPAPRQQQANGTSGCGIMSPWKQELPRLYVTKQQERLAHSTLSVSCLLSVLGWHLTASNIASCLHLLCTCGHQSPAACVFCSALTTVWDLCDRKLHCGNCQDARCHLVRGYTESLSKTNRRTCYCCQLLNEDQNLNF